jgi:uncharacterized membrane-anchored protein
VIARALILLGVVATLAVANYGIALRERTLREGAIVLLRLAPVDPRSLLQGDYMALRYDIAEKLEEQKDLPADGYLIVSRSADQVAEFQRVQPALEPLAGGELAIRYRIRKGGVGIASNAWFFEEGSAERFGGAKYGEIRVDESGAALLTGLRDEAFRRL